MEASEPGNRRQFSRTDVLVFSLIIVMVAGLLLPGVLKVHQISNGTRCRNNLKQLGIACHSINDAYKRLPPVSGHFTGGSIGLGRYRPSTDATLFWWLLPFIEQDNVYLLDYKNTVRGDPHTIIASALTTNIKTFVCPSDPSGRAAIPGTASYAGNTLVFGSGTRLAPLASIPGTFIDGTAFTILFVERYQNCWDPSPSADPTDPQQWPVPGANVPCLWGANLSDYPPTATAPIDKERPAIGIHPYITAGNQGTAASQGYIERPTTFQLTPKFIQDAVFPDLCVAGGAQSPHTGGMAVCMADGSTRSLGLGANATMRSQDAPFPTTTVPPIQTIFNALLTPAGGEKIPPDF